MDWSIFFVAFVGAAAPGLCILALSPWITCPPSCPHRKRES